MSMFNKEEYLKHKGLIESDPSLTLIHEAAHAVAAIRLRIKFSRIKIYRRIKTDGYGAVIYNNHNWNFQSAIINRKTDRIKRHVIMLACGEYAELYCLASKGVNIMPEGDGLIVIKSEDEEQIDALGDLIGLSMGEILKLRYDAAELVLSNWDHIEAVAHALEKEGGELKYFQVRRIMGC